MQTLDEVAEILGPDLIRETHTIRGRQLLGTNLQYPNGDLITVYLDNDTLTDYGGTTQLISLDRDHGELSQRDVEMICYVCNTDNVRTDGDALWVPLEEHTAAAFLRLCQAMLRISMLMYPAFAEGLTHADTEAQ